MVPAATRTPQYASWGYRPLHSTAASAQVRVTGSGSGCAAGGSFSSSTHGGIYSTASAAVVATSAPTCSFRSTSVYIPAARGVGQPVVIADNTPRRSNWDGGPGEDDDPIGTVPDPAPLGDAPWILLLLLSAGYIVFLRLRRHYFLGFVGKK